MLKFQDQERRVRRSLVRAQTERDCSVVINTIHIFKKKFTPW